MRPIASWLIARPRNAVIGLAATLVLPFAQVISGTVMSLLVLQHGAALAAVQALLATALLSVISLLVSAPVLQMAAHAAVIWVPVMLLAGMMRRGRSLTLTLQVAALVAMVATLVFYAMVGNPAAFWTDVLVELSQSFREMGLEQHADALYRQREVIAPQMTILVVVSTWSLYSMVLLLGYAVYGTLPGRDKEFGRFSDLNFGRVLALTMALTSVIALLTGSVWLQNFAFVVFAVFWLQGLAIVHWLKAEGKVPLLLLLLVYAAIPLLNALIIMALAVLGYIDAWFEFRKKRKPA